MAKKTVMPLASQVEKDLIDFLTTPGKKLIFNERELQMLIAVYLSKTGHYTDVCVEYVIQLNNTLLRLDIVVERSGEFVPIEIKFKTKLLDGQVNLPRFGQATQGFNLKNQAAQDIGRYNFWRDVKRVEDVCQQFSSVVGGVSLFVTNDTYYEQDPVRPANWLNFSMMYGISWRKKNWIDPETPTAKPLPNLSFANRPAVKPWQDTQFGNVVFRFTYVLQ